MAVATKDATYLWEGRDKKGKRVSGQMLAPGKAMVSARLRRQGIIVTRVRKQSAWLARAGKIREKDITLFTRQLAVMMKAGVPLLQSFDIVMHGAAKPAVQRLLAEIKADVEKGESLHQAFSHHPRFFDRLFVNLVQAGETAGTLDDVLERLASYREKILAVKGKIKSALFYPAAVIVVAFIVTAAIMIFVIPAFKELFSGFGADLPGPTLFVIALSDFFVANWYLLFGAIGAGLYGFVQLWKKSRRVQRVMDKVLLRLPVFGPVIEKAAIARWTRTLSTMVAAGVPLVEALDSVGGTAGNQLFAEATEKIRAEVSVGSSLTHAMQATRRFPDMVLQLTAIGEESGSLDTMLGKVADFYEREVNDAVEAISSLIEPLLMVVLGTLIGGLVIAMYLPIFKMGSVIGG